MSRVARLPTADLEHVKAAVGPGWSRLDGMRLFLTGGTGFFGKWLVESLLHAIDAGALRASVSVLTRRPGAFLEEAPHLARHPSVSLLEGDVRSLSKLGGAFTHCIHAATEADAALNEQRPDLMLETVFTGTREALAFAARTGVRRFLLTSSGAVQGPQPPDLERVPEAFLGGPDPRHPASAYAEGKRLAELLTAIAGRGEGFETVVARCWAFVGPHLPLDKHFAIGNFIASAIRGEGITLTGDGTPLRSYLYAADLAWWLWTLLASAPAGAVVNVGSPSAISIAELAQRVLSITGARVPVKVLGTPVAGRPPARYVPDVSLAKANFGLEPRIALDDSIRRTFRYYTQLPEPEVP